MGILSGLLRLRGRVVALGLLVPFILGASGVAQPAHASSFWTTLVYHSYAGYLSDAQYSLRGVASSPDGSEVYGSWLHTGAQKQIVEYDASTGAALNSTAPIPGTDGVDYVQAKSVAVDPRGYVYFGSGDVCGDTSCDFPYIQAYSADLQTTYSSVTTPGDSNIQNKRFGGLATWKDGSTYYVYATRESGTDAFYVQRFNATDVNDLTLDTSFGTNGTLNVQNLGFPNAGYPEGIAVASDGTIYVASYDDSSPPSSTDGTVYKIAPNLGSATSASVPGAFGVALAGNRLYVSEYGEGAYPAVDVLDSSTLASVGSLYTGITNTNTDSDSGYSGIAVSPQGTLYLADQFYTSPGYSDRLLVYTVPVGAGSGGTQSQGWVDTTRYSGQACLLTSPFTLSQYSATNAHELDTPNEAILQCTYQSTEHPPSNAIVQGTTGCTTNHGDSYYFYTTENPAGLITLRCFSYARR